MAENYCKMTENLKGKEEKVGEGVVRIEVTKKCPPSLFDCLREFDLVLSRIGAECVGIAPSLTGIGRGVNADVDRKEG